MVTLHKLATSAAAFACMAALYAPAAAGAWSPAAAVREVRDAKSGFVPSTGGKWKELTVKIEKPPKRNLVKLDFRTRGGPIDIEWLKTP